MTPTLAVVRVVLAVAVVDEAEGHSSPWLVHGDEVVAVRARPRPVFPDVLPRVRPSVVRCHGTFMDGPINILNGSANGYLIIKAS